MPIEPKKEATLEALPLTSDAPTFVACMANAPTPSSSTHHHFNESAMAVGHPLPPTLQDHLLREEMEKFFRLHVVILKMNIEN